MAGTWVGNPRIRTQTRGFQSRVTLRERKREGLEQEIVTENGNPRGDMV